jgi:quercetin dioxygenase-like cupin family protein
VPFIDIHGVRPMQLFPGCRIRTPYGQNLMLSYVEIDEGADVPEHHHPHEQAGMVISGRLEFTIGQETRTVEAGAMFLIPPDVPHRVKNIGPGPALVLDVFSPVREDYAAMANRYVPTPNSPARPN